MSMYSANVSIVQGVVTEHAIYKTPRKKQNEYHDDFYSPLVELLAYSASPPVM